MAATVRRPVPGPPSSAILGHMTGLAMLPTAAPAPGEARAVAAPTRPGYDRSAAETASRVVPMLERERVVWLSTVRPDGLPHLVPTWFWWDGAELLVFSKPNAVKVRNLRANPRLMVALGRPDEDFEVGLIEAEAVVEAGPARIPDAFFAKYTAELASAGMDPSAFRAAYPLAIRIAPTRLLPWRGRGPAHEAAAPAAPDRQRPLPDRRTLPGERPAAIAGRLASGLRRAVSAPRAMRPSAAW